MSRVSRFGLMALAGVLSVQTAFGQNAPPPDGPAVAVSQYAEAPVQMETGSRAQRGTYRAVAPETYYSPNLKAHFKAQWMYITQRNQRIEFWGARIISMDPYSPLRELRVNPGDVLTRLDGIPVWNNMYKEDNKPWQLVQLEQHFGRTEVRFIIRGTNQVRIGDMMLDGTFDEEFEDAIPVRP
jgi:hypothetical protein